METVVLSREGQRRGFGLVALAGTLWGTIGPATQLIYGLTATTALSISFFRAVIATPIFLVQCWFLFGSKAFHIPRRNLGIMMMVGVFTGLSQTAYLIAIPLAGVTISTLVGVCIAPVSVALVSIMFGFEPFDRKVMVALVCALVGTVLVVGIKPGTELPHNAILGVVFSVVCGLLYAGAIVCGRFVAKRAHTAQINVVSFASNGVMLMVIGILTGQLQTLYPVQAWLLLLYLGIVPTVVGYGLFMAGMKTTQATIAGIITLLEPVTAAILAAFLFGERLTALGIFGALLLLGAIVVLARGE
ncbi:MAG: EamA family transporter [Anaerolineaceae bacterium]|nr:EamA family transporter [Anaerolineaceae bacterium]